MKRGIARIAQMTPEQLITPVEFFGVFNLPAAFYLAFLNNHSIHHRGEFATYLRPMGSKVPSIYGGSYDEPFRAAAGSNETSRTREYWCGCVYPPLRSFAWTFFVHFFY